jgi:hypothetical protein
VVSIGRSYCLRRMFEGLRVYRESKKAAEA